MRNPENELLDELGRFDLPFTRPTLLALERIAREQRWRIRRTIVLGAVLLTLFVATIVLAGSIL